MTEEEKKHQKELWKLDRIQARREEWEKIRKLGAGARIQYFWDYYKFVLVIIAGAALAVWLVFNVILGMRTEFLLYVCVLNSEELDPDVEHLQEAYVRSRGGVEGMQEIVLDSSIYVNPDAAGTTQHDVAVTMKIAAYVGAGKVDAFLAPPYVTQYEQKNGMYQPLEGLLTTEEIRELGAAGCLYYADEPETESPSAMEYETHPVTGGRQDSGAKDGAYALNTQPSDGSHIYAVRVDQAGVIGQYPIYADAEVWFGLIGNAPHTEEAMRFLHFLLGKGS